LYPLLTEYSNLKRQNLNFNSKMSQEEARKLAVSNFITKVCAMERQIELKRQTLCDRNDFEPYVTF
jgi:hypothetical protein